MTKKLKIGGHKFALKVMEVSDELHGDTDYTENVIRINSSLAPDQMQVTLIHEAIHCMNATMNHEFLDSLSEQLYQFLKDNGLWNEKGAEALLS